MVKKKRVANKHITQTHTHILLRKSLFVYSLLVFIGFVLISLSAYAISKTYSAHIDNQRLSRINTIYDTLKLGNGYYVSSQDVFGDKRVYSWDENRSEASSISGGHNDTPANTLRDLSTKVEAAGFAPAGTSTKGSTTTENYFKNAKGEWIRISVLSATIRDHLMYGTSTKGTPITAAEEQSSPTYFTIWVNLDNNNE